MTRTFKHGRYTLLFRERTAERRSRTWAGIGPAWEYGAGTKTVVGCAVHAGKHLVVLFWRRAPGKTYEAATGPLTLIRHAP